jgi:HAD superfamily hydrolase (TIGR01484 family)
LRLDADPQIASLDERWEGEYFAVQKSSNIKLVVCDIEGCITPPSGAIPWPLEAFAKLRATIEKSSIPFTLLSGRQVAYGEAIVQALNLRFRIPNKGHKSFLFSFFPMILENGCYFFDPYNKRSYPHPALLKMQDGNIRNSLIEARRRLELLKEFGFVEPGKDFVVTISPLSPTPSEKQMDEILSKVKAELVDLNLVITRSRTAVDVAPPGLSKAAGLTYVVSLLEIPREQILGIGDSDVDLDWLKAVGTSACPANATADVKSVVDYVAEAQHSEGVSEILLHYMGSQRSLEQ